MTISIDWNTKIINVPQADLTPLGGANYRLDINTFRLALKDIEDSEEGITFLATHNHNQPVNVGGFTLARVVEIINGYTVTFQDVGSPYVVELYGANSNILDVTNLNQVSVRAQNSAGLIEVSTSGGPSLTAGQVWAYVLENGVSAEEMMRVFLSVLAGKVSGAGTGVESFRSNADDKDRVVSVTDSNGNRTAVIVDGT